MSSFRSPNKPRSGASMRCLPLLCAAVLLAADTASWAQESDSPPPEMLVPVPPDAQAPEGPEVGSGRETKTLKPRLGAQGGEIQVTEIGGEGAIGVGTLTGEDSLPREIWSDTHIETLRGLMPRMPAGTPSPAMNALARRLLLSSVAPPRGPNADEIFAYMRLERLFAAGLVNDAVSFGTLAAETSESEGVLSILARAQMLVNEDEAACRTASRMRLQSEDPFWTRLRAFCYVQDNAGPAALLTANLLEEREQASPLYLTLIRRLANNTAEEVPAELFNERISALDLAMLRRSGLLPPPQAVEDASLALMRTVALTHLNRPTPELVTMRLAAAEEAARRGALAPEDLEQVYGSVPFKPQVRSGAVRYARTHKGPWANALLYQVARAQANPGVAAEYLTVALGTSRDTPVYMALAAVYGDILKSVPQTLDLAPRGFELGLAALAAGAIEEARGWRDILKSSAIAEAGSGQGQVGTARASQTRTLGALLRIAEENPALGWQPAIADNWTKAANEGFVPELQVARELLMLRALGHGLTPSAEAWLRAHQSQASGFMPGPEVLQSLDDAAARGQLGETAILALIAIGPGGPQDTHPIALAKAVKALNSVGLEAEARRLALESIVAVIPS